VEGWKSAFFQSSILLSFYLIRAGSLRLQSLRSAFADTPTRRYADTASFVVAALPRYVISGLFHFFSSGLAGFR
jgi:hypothetical protein